MRGKRAFAVAAIGAAAVLTFSACSDDDDDPTPTPTPTPTTAEEIVHVVCPDPVGEVDVTLTDQDDNWGDAKVNGSSTVLQPIAFGEITVTNETTGETFTDPAEVRPGYENTQAGGLECSFTSTFEDVDENGQPFKGHAEGTVTVLVK